MSVIPYLGLPKMSVRGTSGFELLSRPLFMQGEFTVRDQSEPSVATKLGPAGWSFIALSEMQLVELPEIRV